VADYTKRPIGQDYSRIRRESDPDVDTLGPHGRGRPFISGSDPKQLLEISKQAILQQIKSSPSARDVMFETRFGDVLKGKAAIAAAKASLAFIDMATNPQKRKQLQEILTTREGRSREAVALGAEFINTWALPKAGLPFSIQLDARGVTAKQLQDIPPTVKASKAFPVGGGTLGVEGKYDPYTRQKELGGTYEVEKDGWKFGASGRYNPDTGDKSGHLRVTKRFSKGGRVKSYSNQPRKPKV
tara:strand:+ start:913 stop:1638 length:726 start_codon:yes stop_codon:yes gene_type:complete